MSISVELLQELGVSAEALPPAAVVTCCTWTVPSTCIGATFGI